MARTRTTSLPLLVPRAFASTLLRFYDYPDPRRPGRMIKGYDCPHAVRTARMCAAVAQRLGHDPARVQQAQERGGPEHEQRQPGDEEDKQGTPFVGPAGQLLRRALADAGLDAHDVYVTNAVKHFKWEPRGKRRLHAKPNSGEIQRCAYWLSAELRLIKPQLVVAMGATALSSLLGRNVRVTRDRGKLFATPAGFPVLVTVHPSFLLRLPDPEEAAREQAKFVEDLKKALPFFRTSDELTEIKNG